MTRVFCPVFGSGGRRMEEVKMVDFKDEKTMQTTVGDSLGTIFPDLEVVGHEIYLEKYRIDTVAFNVKTKSFVLIEYKKVQNDDALAQGLAYRGALKGNEGNFLEACKDASGKKYEKKDVAWDKTKVILIAKTFTGHLLKAAEQIKDPIELYRVTKYEDRILTVEMVVGPKQGNSEKSHTNNPTNVKDKIYGGLEKVLHEDLRLEKEPTKVYEKWLLKNGKTVCTVAKQTKTLVLCYTTKSLDRNKADEDFVIHMVKNGKKVGKKGSGDYKSTIQSMEDVNRAVRYLEQVCTQKAKNVVADQRQQMRRDPLSQDDMAYVTQSGASDRTVGLYGELRKILHKNIPNLEGVVKKRYINWKSTTNGASIFTIAVNKNALRLSYNTKRLDVPENDGFVRKLRGDDKQISVAGLGSYDSKLETSMDVKKAIYYIKKVYTKKIG